MDPMVDQEPARAAPRGSMALVLSGGGARAAYQAGLVRGLARRLPELSFPIIVGTSAGAINAAFLAARPGSLVDAAQELCELWQRLTVPDIFRIDTWFLSKSLVRWSTRLASQGASPDPGIRGLVDTGPLHDTIEHAATTVDGELIGIDRNLARGTLKAIALATINYSTGQTVTWVQGSDITAWERPMRKSVRTRMTVEHVMASSALPIVFPAVRLGDSWYGDGGVRLSAPLAPAVHLGADRILAISPRYQPTEAEAAAPKIAGYPPAAQILGHLLDAVFLDVIDQDAERLAAMTRLLEKLPPEERHGMRPIDILVLRPSRDLAALADAYEARLPRGLRRLTRGLGTGEVTSSDFLSMLMFLPEYLQQLIAIGEEDAEARLPEVRRLLAGELTAAEAEQAAAGVPVGG